jgi:mRNA interferase MazF
LKELVVKLKQFEIWTADLNPQIGTEPGKIRPVLIIQTDLLNISHPSTIICPLTTNVVKESDILRVHLKRGIAGLEKPSDLMVDQIRAIDNKRLIKRIGVLPTDLRKKLIENIKIVLDLE